MSTTADTNIKTILTADSTDFEAGMARAVKSATDAEGKFTQSNAKASQSFSNIGGSVEKLATTLGVALSVDGIVQFGEKIVDVSEKMENFSQRTDVSSSFFAKFQKQIENSGGSLDDLSAALNKMNVNIAEAAAGSQTAIDKFTAIHVKISDIIDLSPQQQFDVITTAIANLATQGDKAAGATGVFGKNIQELLPFLSQYATEQGQLDDVLDEEHIKRVSDFGVAIKNLATDIEDDGITALGAFLLKIDELDDRISRYQREHGRTSGGSSGNVPRGGYATFAAGAAQPQIDANRKAQQDAEDAYVAKAQAAGFQTQSTVGGADVDLASEFDAAGGNDNKESLANISAMKQASANALSLDDALTKMQTTSERDIDTSGLSDLQSKLAAVDDQVAALTNQYKTKLSPADDELVAKTKENVIQLYNLKEAQKENAQAAQALGNVFDEIFEGAITSGTKFGQLLGTISKQIEELIFKQLIIDPLKNSISEGLSSLSKGNQGGVQGILSGIGSIFGLAGGGDVGPNQTTLVGEAGPELFTPRSQGMIIPNHALSGGGGNMQVNVINNNGSNVTTRQSANGNNVTLEVMIDQTVGKLINQRGSNISQSLTARGNRTTVAR